MLTMPIFDFKDAAVWRRDPPDGPGHFRRIGGADLAADQLHLCLLPAHRQRVVDVLRRPADGIPFRRAGRGAGDHPATLAVQARGQQVGGEFSVLLDWGIRLSLLLAVPATVGLGLLSGPAVHPVHVWPLYRPRCADVAAGSDCLLLRPAGADSGQGTGTGLLCPAGHQDAGAHCTDSPWAAPS
jgi:hypothetical protein